MWNPIRLAVLAAAASSGLWGCGDSVESLAADYQPSNVPFSQVKPVLLEKCAICHDEYTDSAQILSHGPGEVYEAVKGYYMPAAGVAPLAPQSRKDLLAWLDQNRALWKGGD